MYQNKVGAYQKNDVLTADSMTLVLMCYNAAISNLKIAKTRHADKQFEAKARAINKTLDIMGELMGALNFEKGGQIAKNLNAIYDYAIRRISQADIHADIEGFDEVIRILEDLRNAWKEVNSPKARAGNSPGAALNQRVNSMSVA